MAENDRWQLRVALARAVDRYFGNYAATGGSTTTLVDTAHLARWTETDALKNAWVLITAAGGQVPEDESRRIQAFNYTTKTITVDHAFQGTVEAGDGYELYLAPLSLESWNECINQAIREAWPAIWEPIIEEIAVTGATNYSLNTAAEDVLKVEVAPVASWSGKPGQIMPPHLWTVEGAIGSRKLYLLHPIATSTNLKLRVTYQKRFATLLTENATTDLDRAYLLAAARGRWHEMMAGATRGLAEQSFHLQLMNHWQQVAAGRARELALQLRHLAPDTEGKRK